MTTEQPVDRTSIWGPSHLNQQSLGELKEIAAFKELQSLREEELKNLLRLIMQLTDFSAKYDAFGETPYIYMYTPQIDEFLFVAEVFPNILFDSSQRRSVKYTEDLTYHSLFEGIIQRYTNEHKKPNAVLSETRASNFCYQLTIKIEAIPVDRAKLPDNYRVLREFQILRHIWDSYRTDMLARKCSADQLVGIPMPFEFKNVVGSPKYDFPRMQVDEFLYYKLNGRPEKLNRDFINTSGVGAKDSKVFSSLSYMTVEKLGPGIPYLMQLMSTRNQAFSLSTSLKIFDQLLSRLMILHKYGVIHGDIHPGCLSFGCSEAANVLYINSFDKAVLGTLQSTPIPLFHDRFVALGQAREKKCHYVYDLEAAYYVFIYCVLNRLPWDGRLPHLSNPQFKADVCEYKSRTIDIKEKFWASSESIHAVTKRVTFEFRDRLYTNFSMDILETLHAKMRENLSACSNMPVTNYYKEIFVPGSNSYNCYFGLRKVIASYFRFESLNQTMKDVICTSKLAILTKEDAKDNRRAFDLSHWCWNVFETDPEKKRAKL